MCGKGAASRRGRGHKSTNKLLPDMNMKRMQNEGKRIAIRKALQKTIIKSYKVKNKIYLVKILFAFKDCKTEKFYCTLMV